MLAASVLFGTTGTAATFAPEVSPLAMGAVAMGLGGLLQSAVAARQSSFARHPCAAWPTVALGSVAVAAYPLAFYSSMHLAGVAVGTVVSIGSAPLASAVIERLVDKRSFTGRWAAGAVLGLSGSALLCFAEAAHGDPASASASGWSTPAGIGLGLIAGLTYALYAWAAHRLINTGGALTGSHGHVFGVGGVLLMPVLRATGTPLVTSWQNLSWVCTWRSSRCLQATYCLAGDWPGSVPARRPPSPSRRRWWPPSWRWWLWRTPFGAGLGWSRTDRRKPARPDAASPSATSQERRRKPTQQQPAVPRRSDSGLAGSPSPWGKLGCAGTRSRRTSPTSKPSSTTTNASVPGSLPGPP